MPLFIIVSISVVDCGDAPNRSARMIQNRLDDMRRNLQGRHAACGRPSQVVKNPGRDVIGIRIYFPHQLRHFRVEPRFGP